MIDALIALTVGALEQSEVPELIEGTYICTPTAAAGIETREDPPGAFGFDVRGVTYVFRPLEEDEVPDWLHSTPERLATHTYGMFQLGEDGPRMACEPLTVSVMCGDGVESAVMVPLSGRFVYVSASLYAFALDEVEGLETRPRTVIGTCSEL